MLSLWALYSDVFTHCCAIRHHSSVTARQQRLDICTYTLHHHKYNNTHTDTHNNNNRYKDMREDLDVVDMYAMEMIHNLILSLRVEGRTSMMRFKSVTTMTTKAAPTAAAIACLPQHSQSGSHRWLPPSLSAWRVRHRTRPSCACSLPQAPARVLACSLVSHTSTACSCSLTRPVLLHMPMRTPTALDIYLLVLVLARAVVQT